MIKREKIKTDWNTRYYHIYADYKTIKELDVETVRELMRKQKNKWLILAIGKGYFSMWRGNKHLSMDSKQLIEIIKDNPQLMN